MLNRRLIRIKVLQELYAYYQSESVDIIGSKEKIVRSILTLESRFYDYLGFIDHWLQYINTTQNPEENKYVVDENSKKVYRIFQSLTIVNQIFSEPEVWEKTEKLHISWPKESDFLFLIYKKVIESDIIQKRINLESISFQEQKNILKEINSFLFNDCEEFLNKLEEYSSKWLDEKIPLTKAIEKLIDSIKENEVIKLPLLSKDIEDDIEFSKKLFEMSVKNQAQYIVWISEKTPEWDSDRIAKIDFILMQMALCELIEFPYIPIKVTINEYLELAKLYSTPQSSKFINGILDKMYKELQINNFIKKKGRGLIE